MGLFSTLKAYNRCGICGQVHEYEIQFRTDSSCLDTYCIGDIIKATPGEYSGLYQDPCFKRKTSSIQETTVIVYNGGVLSVKGPFFTLKKFSGDKNGRSN